MNPNTHPLCGQKIIIAGGGIAGLAFAVALRKQWPEHSRGLPPSLTIYERDSKEHAVGREGYSMSLRSDPPGGIQALQKLGILEDVIDVSITGRKQDDAGFAMWKTDMSYMFKVKARVPEGLPVGGMRIARKNLKSVLIKAAAEVGCEVNWGCAVTQVQKLDDGRVLAMLADGKTDSCDLLVAADGAGSRIRAQLRPDDNLEFQNAVLISGTAVFEDGKIPPPVHCDWGMMPTGNGVAVFMSPVDSHSALWSVSYNSNTPEAPLRSPVSGPDAKTLLDKANEFSHLFPDLVKTLIGKTDASTLLRINLQDKPAFAHPANPDFPRVIFVGDANHAVSPFAGNGANMALCDGWDLAEQLGRATSLDEGLKAYDNMVVPRSMRVLRMSHFNIGVAQGGAWRLWIFSLVVRVLKLIMGKYVE